MTWQDITYTVFTIISGVGLVYSLFSPDKPDSKTSFLNLLSSIAFATVQFSMGLIMAFICTSLIAVIWAVLLWQKLTHSVIDDKINTPEKFKTITMGYLKGDEGTTNEEVNNHISDSSKIIIFPRSKS